MHCAGIAPDTGPASAYPVLMTAPAIQPFILQPGETVDHLPLHVLGEIIHMKVTGAQTAGRYSIAEEIAPPGGGPPLHVHRNEDEWFYILEGAFTFQVGEQLLNVTPGTALFGPRGVPHTFANTGTTPGRMIIVFEPAGFEHFFAKMADACRNGMPAPSVIEPIFEEFGMRVLGPPIRQRQSA